MSISCQLSCNTWIVNHIGTMPGELTRLCCERRARKGIAGSGPINYSYLSTRRHVRPETPPRCSCNQEAAACMQDAPAHVSPATAQWSFASTCTSCGTCRAPPSQLALHTFVLLESNWINLISTAFNIHLYSNREETRDAASFVSRLLSYPSLHAMTRFLRANWIIRDSIAQDIILLYELRVPRLFNSPLQCDGKIATRSLLRQAAASPSRQSELELLLINVILGYSG